MTWMKKLDIDSICNTLKRITTGKPIPDVQVHQMPLSTTWILGKAARGILNTGNTCFIASTIQCLQHIPAWNNFLSMEHKEMCLELSGNCFVCKLMRLAESSFKVDEIEDLSFGLMDTVPKEKSSSSKDEFSIPDAQLIEAAMEIDSKTFDDTDADILKEILPDVPSQLPDSENVSDANGDWILAKWLSENETFSNNRITVDEISMNIESINGNMKLYQQEDAHEFLVCLFEKIQKNLLANFDKLNPASEMTTALGKIFGGYLKNQIVCLKCMDKTSNYEEFFSISLEITKVSSVDEALNGFFYHDFSDNFSCAKCKSGQRALKKYCFFALPNTIVLHLKRYTHEDSQATKLDNHISFEKEIVLKQYLGSDISSEDGKYLLRGVTVHQGSTLTSGHYYSYVSDPADDSSSRQWFCMNDSKVSESSWDEVVSDQAYLLYYVKG